jgi:hypothetical protein
VWYRNYKQQEKKKKDKTFTQLFYLREILEISQRFFVFEIFESTFLIWFQSGRATWALLFLQQKRKKSGQSKNKK